MVARVLALIVLVGLPGSGKTTHYRAPPAESRPPLVAIGRRHGARIVAIYFETDVRTAIMRNRQREGRARVPDVAIFTTKKKLMPPTLEEGFDEVRVVAS